MSCHNPISFPVRSRYLSLMHQQRYIVTAGCGKCESCQSVKHRDWYARIYYEWLDCVEQGGYVLFDTLTYNDDNLPHVSRFVDSLPNDLDFSCFDYRDMRLWLARLRVNLTRKGFNVKNGLRQFYCCEYGSINHTFRPHYHVLFFVTCDVPWSVLSREISAAWSLGITDGLPHKDAVHVCNNVFCVRNGRSEIAVSSYVAKYVQKSSTYLDVVSKRMSSIMKFIYEQKVGNGCRYIKSNNNLYAASDFYEWKDGFDGQDTLKKLSGCMMQFHRQSHGFGLRALRDIDVEEVIKTGKILIPDIDCVVRAVPLPIYFLRKLFYRFVEVDGVKHWIPTSDGRRYKLARLRDSYDYYNKKFQSLGVVCSDRLARYVVYQRGRIKGPYSNEVDVIDVLKSPRKVFNYVTPADKRLFGEAFVTSDYVGNSKCYTSAKLDDAIPVREFVRRYVYFNHEYERLLDKISSFDNVNSQGKQNAFVLRERLSNVLCKSD